ncbi:MAG: tyrosine-type recombinase/integrase [Candidatus Amulumruptor caecigallinarius]|nr:tyrosine-type recombinase/integrase [Candidatus Amulumruptor caecigallinarius]
MDIINEFLTYLRLEKMRSKPTLYNYEGDLRQFIDFLKVDVYDFDCGSVTSNDIRSWLGTMGEKGMTTSTRRRRLQAIRTFYKWATRRGIVSTNPALNIPLPRLDKPLPNHIRETEIEDILKIAGKDFSSYRKYIILLLLYSLGIRESELTAITDEDISFDRGEISILGKRMIRRIVPIPGKLADEIKNWQKIRDKRYPHLPTPRALIAGPHGKVSRILVYKIVHDALGETTTGRKSPHTLRHTFATAMVNSGADLDAVREMLGHTSLSTTQIYTHLSINQLRENYNGAHPRSESRSKHEDPEEDTQQEL